MSEKDHISQGDSSEADDLDSLSAEEKAAFEKIMAEISLATGESPADALVPEAGQDDDAGEQTTAEKQPKDTQNPPGNPQNVDPLPTEIQNADREELSDDQLDALNKIMAEIEGKRKSENSESGSGSAEPAPPSEAQASGDQDEAESLSADQQEALNSIMAEIEAKRNTDRDEVEPPPASEEPNDEPLAEDQQEALEKIMADIQAKRDRPVEPEQPVDENVAQPKMAQDQDLTIEEFDDELNNLLSGANEETAQPDGSPAGKTKSIDADAESQSAAEPEIDPAAEIPPQQARPSPNLDAVNSEGSTWKLGSLPELREVTQEAGSDSTARRTFNLSLRAIGHLSLKAVKGVVIIAVLVLTALGGYSGYLKIRQWAVAGTPSTSPQAVSNPRLDAGVDSPSAVRSPSDPRPNTTAEAGAEARNPDDTPSAGTVAEPWINELIAARQHIQNKISELQSLKAYYRKGIETDIQKIEPLVTDGIPNYKAAMADPAAEMTIRSVQRRSVYMAKLDVPLKKLTALSEELLFLERRARLHEILSQGISGVSRTPIENQIRTVLVAYEENSGQLAIDDIQVDAPGLQTVWQDIAEQISRKAKRISLQSQLNKAISAEICSGNYNRLSELTALSAETAHCLSQWEGKDLYLNELTELPTEIAQILSQWPGEWLSLNGLQALSSDTAHHLSQWPGKRLSLNGLSILSPAATQQLSQWKGEQLEMIGLKSIGPWENYGTRLFLSESLHRRLDTQ